MGHFFFKRQKPQSKEGKGQNLGCKIWCTNKFSLWRLFLKRLFQSVKRGCFSRRRTRRIQLSTFLAAISWRRRLVCSRGARISRKRLLIFRTIVSRRSSAISRRIWTSSSSCDWRTTVSKSFHLTPRKWRACVSWTCATTRTSTELISALLFRSYACFGSAPRVSQRYRMIFFNANALCGLIPTLNFVIRPATLKRSPRNWTNTKHSLVPCLSSSHGFIKIVVSRISNSASFK